jgi:hypothetical protein
MLMEKKIKPPYKPEMIGLEYFDKRLLDITELGPSIIPQ